ncbi:MAG: cellobiose phosphorylase, partial [Candidatus Omnitrophica bacterium]|nr:cellobiose phosphorylase [Candidatus Omnitrophota bacterium]
KMAAAKNMDSITLSRELLILLDTFNASLDYDDVAAKQELLFKKYFPAVEPYISGKVETVPVASVIKDLRYKGQWMFDRIRQQEKVQAHTHTWFNGYYDNQGHRVEGVVDGVTRMTLTGQVFPLMSGLAKNNEIEQVIEAVDTFLKDKTLGGYRLNTDFQKPHYLDLGRAFGFAYGTKENGAFFSHMTVMYAYALYKQGFAREGFAVLDSIYRMGTDTAKSWIYPGIPEYFDSLGRGMYHYLTGSASWLVLTVLTQVFGVAGEYGHLRIHPKLVKKQFDTAGQAAVSCIFAGKRMTVHYVNPQLWDYGEYLVHDVRINGQPLTLADAPGPAVSIERRLIDKAMSEIKIVVNLGPR